MLADNFVMMFIFWELVGVSSYILIGHYYGKASAADACKQAFIVNRIGDFGFMLGILMLWYATGSVVFGEIFAKVPLLETQSLYLTIACILVFCGAVGKSAQLPLHVWLPELDGRPDAGLLAAPCGHDGRGGCLHAGARLSASHRGADCAGRHCLGWRSHLPCGGV